MKKQFLFLMVAACLSLTSVSSNASPPRVGIHGPTIKQTVAVQPQAILAITPTVYAMDYVTVELIQATLYNDANPQPMDQLVCISTPCNKVDGSAVLTWCSTGNISCSSLIPTNYRIPTLLFHYIEGVATEYRYKA